MRYRIAHTGKPVTHISVLAEIVKKVGYEFKRNSEIFL